MDTTCLAFGCLDRLASRINPAAWEWYHRVIGKGRCPIVDTWWQTETGAIMVSAMPGAVPLVNPAALRFPLPGVVLDIVDTKGEILGHDREGYLIIRQPWPSMVRTIWGDPERFKEQYWSRCTGLFILPA